MRVTQHICTIFGGVSKDQKAIYLFEEDLLPEENRSYIFLALCQPDGSLLISGPNSNVPIDNAETYSIDSNYDNYLYEIYADAYANEIIPIEHERFISVYED